MNTQELVERCIKRDEPAWDEFVREYGGIVKRAVYYKLNRLNLRALRSEVDDIAQEIFLMIWDKDKLSQLKDIPRLKAWLVMVALNETSNYSRSRWKDLRETKSLNEQISDDEFQTLEDVIPSTKFDPGKAAENKEAMAILGREVDKLEELEKITLKLNVWEGKTQSDIAGSLRIPAGSVATLIHRAKGKVRQGMNECYAS
jgi:RNA polymerase sigma-70 factor (ECF subfamily)